MDLGVEPVEPPRTFLSAPPPPPRWGLTSASVHVLGAHFSGWPVHRVLLGHRGRVTCLLYPHDEYPRYDREFLVSGGADFSVKLWDIFTGDLLYTFSTHGGELLRLSCTPPDCSVSLLTVILVFFVRAVFS